MASEMETSENMTQSRTTNFWPRSERKLQKKLRNTGQEYVSRSGKVIPAKKQPDVLCQCPQRCGEKVPKEVRRKLFAEFYKLGDHALQNEFLMAHIETRAVQRRSSDHKVPGRNQRRVSCKYHIPLLTAAGPQADSAANLQGVRTVEVCQKAFMHVYAITEKRVRLQREKLICQHGITPHTRSTCPADTVSRTQGQEPVNEPIDLRRKRDPPSMIPILMKAPDKDIALVHNFFLNQLWKPEYIGTAT
ncbi:hypothetical protein B7P43_G16551 [Cryptotermes secundus]|uniref:Uncharacterized protein n=1 Tax=Cryptotermes secundus TaxID=105785 RepID=A0A2J7REQ1_9NEOP|nr:uncharacterized protein LOC111861563 [Cryptotermes secundus]PNF39311.1 hypothetical protein B7P43_G16551 [Cryptotermes secundus]